MIQAENFPTMRFNSHFTFHLFSLSILALVTFTLHAEESAESIVNKMVERDKELVRHRSLYTYTVEATREKLDADGKVLGSSYAEVKIQGEKAPNYDTQKDKGIDSDLQQTSQEEPFNILNIISHFDYVLVDSEIMDDTPCFKIRFTPKENQPHRNREEKVANELDGDLWIAKADYSLVRNTGKLTKPVSVAWFFASVRELEFSFQARPLPNGELGPSQIQYRFLVQVMFKNVRERHTRVMKDYTIPRKISMISNDMERSAA